MAGFLQYFTTFTAAASSPRLLISDILFYTFAISGEFMNLRTAGAIQAFPVAFALLWLPTHLWSQFASGTVTGVVKDSTGAVIQAASVTVTELQTGAVVTVKSLHDGAY